MAGLNPELPRRSLSHPVHLNRVLVAAGVTIGLLCILTLPLERICLPASICAPVPEWQWPTRILIAFDCTAVLSLLYLSLRIFRKSLRRIQSVAQTEDVNHQAGLFLFAGIVSLILPAIIMELRSPENAAQHAVLAAVTALLCWFLINATFAIHYAHEYYRGKVQDDQGNLARKIRFGGKDDLGYWDFFYLSFGIGMSYQVADVEIRDWTLRRLVLIHGLLAFLFNLAIFALTISVATDVIFSHSK